MRRYLAVQVRKDLRRKMVFLGGPRQVGKTTLAKSFITDESRYFSWDIAAQRQKILRHEYPPENGILIFDELHKYKSWRNYLKGLFDDKRDFYRILVTGSARLDLYRRGGDSLQGRYHYLRMYPLSVAEVGDAEDAPENLFHYGGFPEPFFGRDTIESRRWSSEYRERLLQDDVRRASLFRDMV